VKFACERSLWIRIAGKASSWPAPARRELGEFLIERGHALGDDVIVGAGEAVRDYETPPYIAAVLRARA
jgi:hypothetical protein